MCIRDRYVTAQEKVDKGFWDYYKEKGIEKATKIGEFIAGDHSQIDPSKLSGMMGDIKSLKFSDAGAKVGDFLSAFDDDILGAGLNKVKSVGSEVGKTITDQFRIAHKWSLNNIFARYDDKDWDTQSKMGQFQQKIGTGIKNFFGTRNLGKKLLGFATMGIKVFASAFLYGAAVLLGLLFFIAIIRKAVPKIVKVWEILGIAKMFFFSVGQILEGIFMILKGLWEGDIIMVLEGLFRFLILGIGGALLTIGLTIVSAILTIVPIILISIGEAIIDMGILLYQRIKSGLGLAGGGTTTGGINLVGERGPELVQLPSGSRVYSNADSKKMLGGNTINVHVNGRVGASDAEIRDIANKVAKEINSRVNRTSTSSMGF